MATLNMAKYLIGRILDTKDRKAIISKTIRDRRVAYHRWFGTQNGIHMLRETKRVVEEQLSYAQ